MKNLTEDEFKLLQAKANSFDEIQEKVSEFYADDVDEELGLDDIGEWIATYLGWLE